MTTHQAWKSLLYFAMGTVTALWGEARLEIGPHTWPLVLVVIGVHLMATALWEADE